VRNAKNRATTHTDLHLRARTLAIPVRTLHNASIINAIGCVGLQLYNFGQTVSMVFFTETWRPSSWYDRVAENRALGLHTLVLLDIKVKEQSWEAIALGRKGAGTFLPPRYMTVAQCCQQMVEIEEERKGDVCGGDCLAVGVGRCGSEDQVIVAGTLRELAEADLGEPLHSVVLLGSRVHALEMDFIREFAVDKEVFDRVYRNKYGGEKERTMIEEEEK
jgi:diphthine synthase